MPNVAPRPCCPDGTFQFAVHTVHMVHIVHTRSLAPSPNRHPSTPSQQTLPTNPYPGITSDNIYYVNFALWVERARTESTTCPTAPSWATSLFDTPRLASITGSYY